MFEWLRKKQVEKLVSGEDFGNGPSRVMYELLAGAIGDKKKMQLDPEQTMFVLESLNTAFPVEFIPAAETPILQVRQVMRQVIRGLVDDSILTPGKVMEIGRYFRPSNLETSDETSDFDSRIVANAGNHIKSKMRYANWEVGGLQLGQMAKKVGITLSPQQEQELYMNYALGHEYGHAIVSSQKRNIIAKLLGNDWEYNGTASKMKFDDALSRASDIDNNNVYSKYPLGNPDLERILAQYNKRNVGLETGNTSRERVSSGMEYLVLANALKRWGTPKNKIELFEGVILKLKMSHKDDFVKLHKYCQDSQLDFATIPRIFSHALYFAKRFNRADLIVGLPDSFDTTMIGYDYPLNRQQIVDYVNST